MMRQDLKKMVSAQESLLHSSVMSQIDDTNQSQRHELEVPELPTSESKRIIRPVPIKAPMNDYEQMMKQQTDDTMTIKSLEKTLVGAVDLQATEEFPSGFKFNLKEIS